MQLLFQSAHKQRDWLYEIALFTAWHVAAFSASAKAGKLHDWSYYRAKLRPGAPDAAPPQMSWQEQKAARKRQMEQRAKDQRRRQAPVRVARQR